MPFCQQVRSWIASHVRDAAPVQLAQAIVDGKETASRSMELRKRSGCQAGRCEAEAGAKEKIWLDCMKKSAGAITF